MLVDKRFIYDVQSLTREDQPEMNAAQAKILLYIKANPGCTMQQIYFDLNLPDVMMYLAIHELVFNQLINGYSPYDIEHDLDDHNLYTYTIK